MQRTLSAFLFTLAFSLAKGAAISPSPAAAVNDSSMTDSAGVRASADSAGTPRVEATGLILGAGDLREPVGVAVDSRGFVYVADAMAGKVFRYAPDGESLEFEHPPNVAAFYPIDIAVQESFILVLDYSGNRLLRYDFKGSYLDVFISFDEFDRVRPVSITAGAGGRLLTTDISHHTVTLWSPLLEIEHVIGDFGRSPGSFNGPRKAAFLPDQSIVVVESGNKRLQLFSPSGGYRRIAVPPEGKGFHSPRSLCANEAGSIFVCDPDGGRIVLFSDGGDYLGDIDSFGDAGISPAAAAVGWDGNLYVADLTHRAILVYRLQYQHTK